MIGRCAALALTCLAVTGVAAAGPSASTGHAEFGPVQSISYEFGSKFVSGYFVPDAATCAVTLMIGEKPDAEQGPWPSAARVRLVLYPGQIVGLDSEEGRSLNVTCGEGAAKLLVDAGDRDTLATLQNAATIAQKP